MHGYIHTVKRSIQERASLIHALLAALVVLAFAVPVASEPSVDLVRISKSEHKLQVISGGRVIHQFQIALGRNPKGPKTREGDGKTPEGRYTLDYKKTDSAFYKAIHVSYPNANDIAKAHAHNVAPGGQIMIHGQKNGFGLLSFITQHFDWTKGCIAVTNSDMDILWPLVKVGTAVEILP
jgi:murein L,D-transpeptidase YafK